MQLQVKKLTKDFNNIKAVDELSFELNQGECVALLGANGAGKTTTLRMLAGLLKPTDGTIEIEGSNGKKDVRSEIGYLPQHPVFHGWMTGMEFLVFVGKLAHLSQKEAKTRAIELLERVGISDAANMRIHKYSGGMKQRLGIAQSLIHQPRLLLMDEPVSSLDPIGRREVLTLLKELKKETTLLFSTHILNDAEEISDGLIVIDHGKIKEKGSLEALQKKYQNQKIDLHFETVEEKQIEEIEALEGIESVLATADGITCMVSDLDVARESVLNATLSHNWSLNYFTTGKTTLEDMFMEVLNQ
ncbi:ABC-2 type transport system ATP-binding protein [Pelagirhabdus alkalitolerans]|uniref:ABC-2 type transport system ATP-binding protein n=1 Tax=Pelagirhabdus alkalitolerans TaxID=1612202 RepID=A0A1G6IFY9_9BACI|nr:ABC transporter ATP-binding protein [Pelagirhabdus alkalitolerans]SDC05462.1 ABC-2 type transport system ATP-binding protein [Pelagirhabdus alkalitolerans]